jgi:CubicO group peptidase (beta-lactamase class C family)
MIKATALAIFLTACLAAPAMAQPDPEAADAAIRAFLARHDIPSAHVTLLRGDTVVLQRGYGSVAHEGPAPDAASVFPIGSISKQFTAPAILALADEGKVRLDAPVREYLPEWFAREPELRITHLLSQTSGLADFLWLDGYRPLADDPATPIEAYVALGASAPRRFAPGTRWAYSNTNYKALALIAERVTGQTFDDVLATRVLRPVGIDDIVSCHRLQAGRIVPGVNVDGKPAPLDASPAAYTGDGGLCASAASLSKWLRRVLASPDANWSRLKQESQLSDGSRVPYGFGLSTREFLGHAMVWHGGNVDSHSAMIGYLPDEQLGLIVLLSRGFIWPTELMPALIGARPPVRGSARGAPPAGNFEDGLFRYAVTPEADALQVEIDLIGKFRFIPVGPYEYVAEELPATFRIRLPTDGPLDRFEFDWGEVRSYARRVSE